MVATVTSVMQLLDQGETIGLQPDDNSPGLHPFFRLEYEHPTVFEVVFYSARGGGNSFTLTRTGEYFLLPNQPQREPFVEQMTVTRQQLATIIKYFITKKFGLLHEDEYLQ